MTAFEPATPDHWVVDQAVLAVLERWPPRESSWRGADLHELVELVVDAAFEAAV